MSMRIAVSCFMLTVLLTGCGAHQTRVSQQPEAPALHWRNEDNRRIGIATPWPGDCREVVKPEPKTG